MLSEEPTFEDKIISLDITSLKDVESPASWVKFGLSLKIYKLKFPEGDPLVIKEGRTWLRVHRFWILSFGLLGRYCSRKDKGKLRDDDKRVSFGTPVLNLPRTGTEVRSVTGRGRGTALHGFTGLLQTSLGHESPTLTFTLASADNISIAVPEKLLLSALFWLALGCIPAENKYFSLEDSVKEDSDDEDDDWDDVVYRPRYTPTSRRMTHPRQSSWRRPVPEASSSSTLPSITRPADPDLISFRLAPIPQQGARFGSLPPAFRNDKMQAYGLQEFTLPPDHPDQISLEAIGSVTFVPAATPWVRLSKGDHGGQFVRKHCYLRREDAHQMAYALLTLAWHPESYLIGSNRSTLCRDFLSAASPRFMQIVAQMKTNVASLGLGSNERAKLFDVLALMEKKTARLATHRSTLRVLYDIDVVLSQISHNNVHVNDIIGILMLTNEEFAGLVSQSARHLEVSTSSVVEIDLRAGSLKVPSAFGIMQSFIVDVHAIYTDATMATETISVNHTMVLVAALKACLRSFMLENCLEAEPLFKLLEGDSEVLEFD